jgi:hypothetical protein
VNADSLTKEDYSLKNIKQSGQGRFPEGRRRLLDIDCRIVSISK